MSDDLISRKALFGGINSYHYDTANPEIRRAEHFVKAHICELVDKQPTAYDADKVVKTINEIGQRYCNSVKCDKNCKDCEHGCLMRAITNAVKSGGVAND